MKHFLLFFLALCTLMVLPRKIDAQTYYHTPITNLTGWSRDIIANTAGYTVTTHSSTPQNTLNPATEQPFDNISGAYGGLILFGPSYTLGTNNTPAGPLPADGSLSSTWNSESHNFQLQGYGGNNSLWLNGTNAAGTLTFPTAQSYSNLYILAISGNNASTANVVVNYSSGSSTTFTNKTIANDWFGGAAISATTLGLMPSKYSALIDASNTPGQTGTVISANNNVKLYESNITIDSTRTVTSVQFTNTTPTVPLSNGGQLNILAITGTPSVIISGKVFSDGTNDATANGTGTNAGAGYAVLTLNGVVRSVATINSDGTYVLGTSAYNLSTTGTPYKVILSTTSPTIGNTLTSSSLNANWYDSPNPNASGTGTQTGAVSAAFSANSASLSAQTINFGIHNVPTSDTKTYTIPYGVTTNQVFSMTSDATSGSTLGQLSGASPYSPTTLNGNNANLNVKIVTVPANGQLLYNGAPITANTTISNYDKAKLTFKFTGSGYKNTSFTYNISDALGFVSSSNATYTINLLYALPVKYTQPLSVQQLLNANILTWTTGEEINNKNFEVQRSDDPNSNWNTLTTIPSYFTNGNGSGHAYSYTDNNPLSGLGYYRLLQIDLDGVTAPSSIVSVYSSSKSTIQSYPNPVMNQLHLSGLQAGSNIKIFNIAGVLLQTAINDNTTYTYNATNLVSGVYIVQIIAPNGTKSSMQFIKK